MRFRSQYNGGSRVDFSRTRFVSKATPEKAVVKRENEVTASNAVVVIRARIPTPPSLLHRFQRDSDDSGTEIY